MEAKYYHVEFEKLKIMIYRRRKNLQKKHCISKRRKKHFFQQRTAVLQFQTRVKSDPSLVHEVRISKKALKIS